MIKVGKYRLCNIPEAVSQLIEDTEKIKDAHNDLADDYTQFKTETEQTLAGIPVVVPNIPGSDEDPELTSINLTSTDGTTTQRFRIPSGGGGATLYKHFIKFSFQSITGGVTYHGFIEIISSNSQQIGTQAELYQALNKQPINICYVVSQSIVSVEDATSFTTAFMKAYSDDVLEMGNLYFSGLNQGAPSLDTDTVYPL